MMHDTSYGSLQEEVSSMVREFVNRSARLGEAYNPPRLKVMDYNTLKVIIPALISDLLTIPMIDFEAIAKKWRLDPSVVLAATQAVNQHRVKFEDPNVKEPVPVVTKSPMIYLSSSSIEKGFGEPSTSNLGV